MNRKFSARSGHCEVAEFSVDVSTRQDLRGHCERDDSPSHRKENMNGFVASAPRNDED